MSPHLKPFTYGLMHLCVAIAVAYGLTGSWEAALAIGLIEPFVQTFAYSIHERLWTKGHRRAVPSVAASHGHPHLPVPTGV